MECGRKLGKDGRLGDSFQSLDRSGCGQVVSTQEAKENEDEDGGDDDNGSVDGHDRDNAKDVEIDLDREQKG